MHSLNFIFLFVTSLILSLILIPIIKKVAHAKNLYDLPDHFEVENSETGTKSQQGRRVHTQPIPRLGGIAIVVSFFVTLIIWKIPSNMMVIILCSLAMFLTGLVDDVRSLSAKLRLIVQIAISVTTVFSLHLGIDSIAVYGHFGIEIPQILGDFLSIFIIIGAINAINMIDGLDGLAGGVVMISLALLSYLHFLDTNSFNLIAYFSLPIAGALLGFLRFNTHPSTIFMGDSGSNWLGYMVGVFVLLVLNRYVILQHDGVWVLTTSLDNSAFTSVTLLSVVMCLALPVFDTAHVILLRLSEGKNPMYPDKRHFHHSLMKIGLSHSQSVTAVYFISILFGVLGILPTAYPAYHLDWVPWLGLGLLLFVIIISQRLSDDFILKVVTKRFHLPFATSSNSKVNFFLQGWEHLNRYAVYAILLAAPLFAGASPKPIGMAAGVMAFGLCVSVFIQKRFNFFESFVFVLAAIVLLTAINSNVIWVEVLGQRYSMQRLYNFIFIALLISTFFFFLATFKRKYLVFVPTDFLLVVFPLILLLLPKELQSTYKLNIIALRSLVIFAAVRTLGKRHPTFFYKVHFLCIISLLWVALTSVFGLKIVY